MIFHGKVLQDTDFNNPSKIYDVFQEKVDIVTHNWQFADDELRKKILSKKIVSFYLDIEADANKTDEHLHAIV